MTLTHSLSARTAALLLPLVTAVAGPAVAHVTLEQAEAQRGTSYKAVLKVPHGCDGGQATHTVRVEIPEGFIAVKPMPKPGWKIETRRGPYAATYEFYHGRKLSEGVKEIVWSGGELPNDYYDEFVAAGFVAREIEDKPLYFKVVQLCAKGELQWVEVPGDGVDPHDLAAPAAMLRIAAGDGHDAHDHHGHGHRPKHGEHKPGAAGGPLAVEDAWARATAEGAKVGAGYLTIRNAGPEADTLIAVEADFAGRSEIHDMTTTDDGVMRMRPVTDGLAIPAGGSVALKPGGLHVMFLDLKAPLVAGQSVRIKLRFKSGAESEVDLPVKPIGGDGGGHHHHHHH